MSTLKRPAEAARTHAEGISGKRNTGRTRLALDLLRVGLHLLSGLCQCAVIFPFSTLAARNTRIQRWSLGLLRIFRISLHVDGDVAPAGALVANHVSWIDVFVLNAARPCRFVAKSEVRGWPAIGWLSASAGTLYVDRGSRFGLRSANAMLAQHLQAGERVAFFPEGTSAPQGTVLPFHANLFGGVVAAGAAVLPAALRYVDRMGRPSAAAEYIGDMSLGQSIVRLLSDGPLVAQLRLLPALHGDQRRELAAAAQASIAAALQAAD